MNFDFTDDERAIKDQARRFLDGQKILPMVRAMLDGGSPEPAAALWHAACALGWPGTAIPEIYGGFGAGHVALCAIAEEVGRACAPLPMFASAYLATESLLQAGSAAQKQRWLPALAEGTVTGTALLDTESVLPVVRDGILSGTLSPLPQGLDAGVAIVAAQEDGAASLFLVELSQPAIMRRRIATIDDSRPHAIVTLDGADAERLGRSGDGRALGRRIEARAAVFTAFEQLGGADAALQMALAYARERRSFGRVIGSYQAIKHKLADMYVKNELARSNAYYGAWALGAADANTLELAAATARVSATEAFEFASAETIEVHGGIGFTWEADPHLYYRRSRLLALALGPLDSWRCRLVQALDRGRLAA